jgi:assimilatory nitrate reductase catalytic subunit
MSERLGPVVETHCPYCALNCGIGLQTDAAQRVVIEQKRWKGSPLTAGAVCSKGSTAWQQIDHGDRITRPLIRRNGQLVPCGWEEALDVAADGFLAIKHAYGPDANAVLSGGSITNEKAYLVGKLARLAFGTRHVDYNGRFCMVSAGAANLQAFGRDRAMTPLSEVEKADTVVVVGANLSDAYPVMLPSAIAKARKRGANIIVIDPRFGRWVKPDDLKVAIRPASDGVLFAGLLNELARLNLIDWHYVRARTVGFDDSLAAVKHYTPEVVAALCDVTPETLTAIARALATVKRAMILHARGPEQQVMGTNNVLAMINVALACGLPGRPGSGINMLTGQRNGQGGREWGQRCNQLPAGRSITNPEHRSVVAERWGVPEASIPGQGATYMEILDLIGDGQVRGLLSICNNPSVSAPNLAKVDDQLSRLEHAVFIDPFLSETALRHAHVVLPGSTWAEEEGTVTTIEGRVVRCDQAVPPVADRADLDVIRNLARRLGASKHFSFARGRDVFEEMRMVSAGGPNDYAGITWDRARQGVFWPCPTEDHAGTPQLYIDRFAHADGKARCVPFAYAEPPVLTDDEYPLVLTTGRHLAQFLSGNQTKRIPSQNDKAPAPYVELHPETAAALGVTSEDSVRLRTRQGVSTTPWIANEELRRDTVFMPYHWEECNRLVASDLDPTSKIPGFKYTPVHVGKAAALCPETAHSRGMEEGDGWASPPSAFAAAGRCSPSRAGQ